MVGAAENCIQCLRLDPVLDWNRFLLDLKRGSNSLNLDSDLIIYGKFLKFWTIL